MPALPRPLLKRVYRPFAYTYSAAKQAVLSYLPELGDAARAEEDDFYDEGGLSYVLIEDIVWPDLRLASHASGDDHLVRHAELILALFRNGDSEVQNLVVIGLIQQIEHDRRVRRRLRSAGYESLTYGWSPGWVPRDRGAG